MMRIGLEGKIKKIWRARDSCRLLVRGLVGSSRLISDYYNFFKS
jgi:hypothetical protein